MVSATVTIVTDSSALDAAMRDLKLELDRLEPLPEFVRDMILGLLAHARDEITVEHDAAASSANKLVVRLGVRAGGRFEFCVSALRAFRPDVV